MQVSVNNKKKIEFKALWHVIHYFGFSNIEFFVHNMLLSEDLNTASVIN